MTKYEIKQSFFYGIMAMVILLIAVLLTILFPTKGGVGVCTAKEDSKKLIAAYVEMRLDGFDPYWDSSFVYSNLSEQEKRYVVYQALYQSVSVTAPAMQNYAKENLGFSLETKGDIIGPDGVIARYDGNSNSYFDLNIDSTIKTVYTMPLKYQQDGNQYLLLVTKIFKNGTSYYGTYQDALDKKQAFFTDEELVGTTIAEYVGNHKATLEDQVTHYRYTFGLKNKTFFLKNMEIVD